MVRKLEGTADPGSSIWDAFQSIALNHGDDIAIDFERAESWTYSQLYVAVYKVALRLSDAVTLGQLVPVLLPRSPAQVVAILAIAKLGAVYVPIDPSLPPSRISSLLTITNPSIVVCQVVPQQQTEAKDRIDWFILDQKADPHDTAVQALPVYKELPQRKVHFHDLAAVLFTSGSTGTPKGVRLTHRNLIWPARLLAEKENIGNSSSVFQFAQPSFDVHLIDILCAVLHGARLCQVRQENLMSDLNHWIKLMQPNTIHLTPSTISMLNASDVQCLDYMVTCGEPVTQGLIDSWSARLSLTNLYGQPRIRN